MADDAYAADSEDEPVLGHDTPKSSLSAGFIHSFKLLVATKPMPPSSTVHNTSRMPMSCRPRDKPSQRGARVMRRRKDVRKAVREGLDTSV